MSLTQPFLAVAYSFIVNECGDLSPETAARVVSLLQELIRFHTSRSTEISQQIATTIGRRVSALERINAILKVPSKPIPEPSPEPLSLEANRKTNFWSQTEDDRLFAGIQKYGIARWIPVAKFVGNGRTRAQCSQRWNRTLDPQLKRTNWSDAEERELAELVDRYGLKSWTRIAHQMVRRSDVQCRYHWLQMERRIKAISPLSSPAEDAAAKQRTAACLHNSKAIPPGSIWDWMAPTGFFDAFAGSESDDDSLFF
jgi:hypothetical protein